jgi:hypothetical protein
MHHGLIVEVQLSTHNTKKEPHDWDSHALAVLAHQTAVVCRQGGLGLWAVVRSVAHLTALQPVGEAQHFRRGLVQLLIGVALLLEAVNADGVRERRGLLTPFVRAAGSESPAVNRR